MAAVKALTISAVKAWVTSSLDRDAVALGKVTGQVDTGVVDLSQARRKMREAWGGPAASAAYPAVSSHIRVGEDLVENMDDLKRALRRGADDLKTAQDNVAAKVAAARADNCRVDDDGTAHPPPVAMYGAGAPVDRSPLGYVAMKQVAAEKQQAQVLADSHTAAIKAALRAADETDTVVAATLKGIDLPAGLEKPTARVIEMAAGIPTGASSGALPVTFPKDWRLGTALRYTSNATWTLLVGLGASPFAVLPSSAGQNRADYYDKTGYYGGGVIVGPDGREYPLVIPQVVRGGLRYHADAVPDENRIVDLDGNDKGWHLVGHHQGIDSIDPVSTATKISGAFSVGTGVAHPTALGERVRSAEAYLAVGPTGFPGLTRHPGLAPGPLDRPVGDPRDNPVDKPWWNEPAEPPGVNTSRAGRLSGGADLVRGVGEGVKYYQDAGSNSNHAYTVDLEANEDGRTRALVRTYDVIKEPLSKDRELSIATSYAYLDPESHRVRQVLCNFYYPDGHDPSPAWLYHRTANPH